ncbi:type II toxin-antitoxin system VapC family toxin [Rhodocaloribacter sp.]
MVDKRCVIDTNVLIYSTVEDNPWYDEARQWLAAIQSDGTSLCITTQIYREYLVVLTRGDVFKQTFSPQEALEILDVLAASVMVLGESIRSFDIFRDLVQRYEVKGKSIHDANVVAVMVDQKIRRLATYIIWMTSSGTQRSRWSPSSQLPDLTCLD